jgi:uncharacterized membrane protein SpoIIM required for sporulation
MNLATGEDGWGRGMSLERFETERSPSWSELEGLLASAGGRPERLGVDGVLELGRLYRAVAADLALARRRFPGYPVLDRLESLVARARQSIYGERSRRGSVRGYLLRGYWQEIRAQRRLLSIVALAMITPTLLTAAWAVHNPVAASGLIPAEYSAAASPHPHSLPSSLSVNAAFASSIFTHNIVVSFLYFGGGLLFGLGTLWLLVYNHILLGTLAGLSLQAGTFSIFVRLIVRHGLLELSCFAIAGVAGLCMARALVDPGLLPRSQALRREARRGVQLILGTMPWLVVAGLTEGFVTPRKLSVAAALAVGFALFAVFWSLVLTAGRSPRSAR